MTSKNKKAEGGAAVKKTIVVVMAVALGAAACAEDVTLERSGFVRCAFGGGITVGGLVNYANWSNSAQPVFSVSNKTGYVLGSRGETFAEGRWTLGADGAGGVKLDYTAGDGAKLEILLDDLNAEPVAVIDLPAAAEARSELFSLPQTIIGTHDLYFRFSQADMALLQWQFFSPLQGQ